MKLTKIATRLIERLRKAGHIAYFAGGWVRDLLLDLPTDEIDIATDASPEQVMALFSKTVPVGIAFGVVLVIEEGVQFEVSTFRKDHPYFDGRHPDGVDYSTPEQDAWRRDFTINGMFYDPLTQRVIDYVGGQEDLKKGVIRAIGDPQARFAEDRLRMMRAVRFAHRLNFALDPATADAIRANASSLLPAVSMERIWQELEKMAKSPHFNLALLALHELGLLPTLFPSLASLSVEELKGRTRHMAHFLPHWPLVVFLLELFPEAILEEFVELLHRLKTSHHMVEIATFFFEAKRQLPLLSEPVDWVHFYAHPHVALFLEVERSKQEPGKKEAFVALHAHKQEELAPHIQRLTAHTPLLRAHHLMEEGIAPGVLLGKLLREGERLVVNGNLSSVEQALQALKSSPLWPT